MTITDGEGLELLAQLAAFDPDAPVQFTVRAADAARALPGLLAVRSGALVAAGKESGADLLTLSEMCGLAGRSPSTVRAWLKEAKDNGSCPEAFKLSGVDWRCPRAAFMALLRGKQPVKKQVQPAARVIREPIGAWRGGNR